jgi:hypothetical protein
MIFCSLWVSFYRSFEQNLQYENLIIQTRRFSGTAFLHSWRTKHLNSTHQLFPTASFSPQPAFQKSWSEKSRTKHAHSVGQTGTGGWSETRATKICFRVNLHEHFRLPGDIFLYPYSLRDKSPSGSPSHLNYN